MKGENVILLGCLLYDQDLMERAAKKYGRLPMFDPVKHPGEAVIWTTLRECYTAMGGNLPTPATFLVEMENRLAGIVQDPELRRKTEKILNTMFTLAPEQFNRKAGLVYLNDSFIQLAKTTWVSQIRGIQNMHDVAKVAKLISYDFADMNMASKAKRVKPLLSLSKYMVKQDRKPLGIPFWDARGGSFIPGEIIGLLGPSGGGKTVLSMMVLCEQAKRGEHCIYFTYEQEIAGDIIERICCYLSGVPITEFREKGLSDLAPEVRAKLNFAHEIMERITIVDLSSGDFGAGGTREVIEHIEDAKNDNETPGIVIIDWLGAMIDRNAAKTKNVDMAQRYRILGPQFVDDFGMYFRDAKVAGMIVHQLCNEAGSQPSGRVPTKYDAHEFKSFCQKMTSMGCLGTLEKDYNICIFNPAKTRKTDARHLQVHLNGKYQKFEEASGHYKVDYSHHIRAEEAEDGEADIERHKKEMEQQ